MLKEKTFQMLRKLLRALGLSEDAVEDLIAWIEALLKGEAEEGEKPLPYRLRDDFLSPAERSFYQVLKGAVGSWADVCPKVNLADLFYVSTKDPGEWRALTNRIDRKHVDFVLCDPRSATPLVAVELDDRTHGRRERRARDRFVDRVFEAAGLPLVRIRARAGYNPAELDAALRRAAGLSPEAEEGGEAREAKQEPTRPCPKCGGELVVRKAKSGPNRGRPFWGCLNFPRCRFVEPIGEGT